MLFDTAAYLSDLPIRIQVDAEGRPHSMDGAAIGYANGFGVYCVHGLLVPEDWVLHPERLTPKQVDDEPNAERRSALLMLYGMGRYIADSKSTLVDEVPDDCAGYDVKRPSDGRIYPYGLRGARLWRRTNAHGDVIQAVELKNSTVEIGGRRKTFFIGVSAKSSSVEEAVAWSYGFETAAEYYPQAES